MKTFLVILIALIAAIASGYYVTHGMNDYVAGGESAVSSSSNMLDALMVASSSSQSSVSVGNTSSAEAEGASYLAYHEGVIGNGERAVLFFHAAWCPFCRTADIDLKAIYGAGQASVNTYRIDYDTATELRKRYGVTYQHTFVVIDGEGNAKKTIQGATKAQLEELVK